MALHSITNNKFINYSNYVQYLMCKKTQVKSYGGMKVLAIQRLIINDLQMRGLMQQKKTHNVINLG
jgi:hypothetical protein